jgi:hypothetical protein
LEAVVCASFPGVAVALPPVLLLLVQPAKTVLMASAQIVAVIHVFFKI